MSFNSGMTISHGIGEAYTAAKLFDGYYDTSKYTLDKSGLDKLRNDAHESIKYILPDLPSYFQLNGNITQEDKANRKTTFFLRDRRTGEDKDYDVEW